MHDVDFGFKALCLRLRIKTLSVMQGLETNPRPNHADATLVLGDSNVGKDASSNGDDVIKQQKNGKAEAFGSSRIFATRNVTNKNR